MIKKLTYLLVVMSISMVNAQTSLQKFAEERNCIVKRTTIMSESIEVIVYDPKNDTVALISYNKIICKKKNKIKCVTLEKTYPYIEVSTIGEWEITSWGDRQCYISKSGDFYTFTNRTLSTSDFIIMTNGIARAGWKWYD